MASKEDAASCPICQEIYHDPRCLLCGHSFCLECIKGVADNKKWFSCPICRFRVNLGDGKVDQLPKNYVLSNVIEAKDKTNPSLCLKHNKLLDIFCEQCDMVICSKCLSMQHRGHVIEDIDKIFNERNEQLAAFFTNTKLSVSMIQEKRSVIEQSRNAMQKNADSIHKTVDNMFKKWYDALHAKQNAVLSYIRQERDKKIQVYVEAESILLKSLTNVTELEEEISQTMSKDMAFVIQQYGSIRARHEDTGHIVLLNIKTYFTPPDDLKIEVCAPWIEEAISNIKYTDMMKRKARPQTRKISEIEKENNILKRNKEQLECENKCLKNLLSDLHKYGTSRTKGSTFEKPSTDKPDKVVTTQYQQAQDIYSNFKEMERKMEQLEYENKFLKTLLSELHTYGTSHTKARTFEEPSTVKPGKAVTTQYQQAKDIYNNFKEMKRKNDVLVNETEALQMTVEEMTTTLFGEEHESLPLQDAVQQISTEIDSLMLDLESVKTEKTQLQSACNKLLITNDTYKRDNEQLQKSVQDVVQCLTKEEQNVSVLQKKVQSMVCDLQSANTEIWQLQKTNDAYKRKNKALQMSVEYKDECLSREEENVSVLNIKIERLERNLASSNTERWELRNKNYELVENNNTLQKIIIYSVIVGLLLIVGSIWSYYKKAI